jgi:hypothetical protein
MKSFLRSREGSCIAVLALLAALRVFLFSAAFPFFTNVDEHRHVDGVLKYASGYLPRPENSGYEPEMARYIGVFGSPEYHFHGGAEGAREVPPPPWRRSSAAMLRSIEWGEKFFAKRKNLESMQPPAYYAMAGLWLRLGRALGFRGGGLLYWVRGLGTLLVFALVISSYLFLREIYPDDRFMRLGVPLLVSVFPTDVFFYVTRDALSPLVAGIGFFLALRIVTACAGCARGSPWRGARARESFAERGGACWRCGRSSPCPSVRGSFATCSSSETSPVPPTRSNAWGGAGSRCPSGETTRSSRCRGSRPSSES